MKHPHTAAILVVASVVALIGLREIEHRKPLPLKPLPLCEEVGDALQSFPPMTQRDAPVSGNPDKELSGNPDMTPKTQATPLPPKRIKKKAVNRPQVNVIAPPPERPDWTPLTWWADILKAIFGVKS